MVHGVATQPCVATTRPTGRIVVGMKNPSPARKKREKKTTAAVREPRSLPVIESVAGAADAALLLFELETPILAEHLNPRLPGRGRREKLVSLYKVRTATIRYALLWNRRQLS